MKYANVKGAKCFNVMFYQLFVAANPKTAPSYPHCMDLSTAIANS